MFVIKMKYCLYNAIVAESRKNLNLHYSNTKQKHITKFHMKYQQGNYRNLTMFASTLFPIWRSMEREGRAVDWYQWTLRARNDGMPKLLLQAKLVSVFTENSLKILTDTYWYFRPPSDFYQWFDPLLVELNSSTMHYIYFQNLSKSVWIFRLPRLECRNNKGCRSFYLCRTWKCGLVLKLYICLSFQRKTRLFILRRVHQF